MPTVIEAKQFAKRSDLESHVRNNIGLSPDLKPEYEIHGTIAELSRLQLGSTSLFWGIKCLVDDVVPTNGDPLEPPERGPTVPFGMNGQVQTLDEKLGN